MDVKHVIEDVLRLKMKYLVQEPRGNVRLHEHFTGLVTDGADPHRWKKWRAASNCAAKAVGSLKRIWTDKSGLGTNFPQVHERKGGVQNG